MTMDQINPTNHALTCPEWESGLVVSVCLIAIGAALYAANAAQGIPT
jgi:hypothetical protein